jgi:hypothetical protein
MSQVPHELAEEFPGQAGCIRALKVSDGRFAAVVERHRAVNRTLYRMEERIEPVSEETERASRRERLRLKDEIARILHEQTEAA